MLQLPTVLTLLLCALAVGSQNPLVDQLRQLGLFNIFFQTLLPNVFPPPHQNAKYDFIVVGAGSAGCALAARLSENPNWRVALLEAGGVENIFHKVPVLAAHLQMTGSNWGYRTVPQKHACFGMKNNRCAVPHGKVLGGTSAINQMIYMRGNRQDYDAWAAAGNTGWSYDEVLPYFLRGEHSTLHGMEQSPYHNKTGPLRVEDVRMRSQLAQAYVDAAVEAGHARTDYNGETQLGVSFIQATTNNGRRHSAFAAYIEPIRAKRSNLHIFPFSRATRVLIEEDTKSAYGVKFVYQNQTYTFHAHKEVILSAGSFNSPQLLMLSGIGPQDNLKAIGVPLVAELPVGKLLYDHMSHFGPTWTTNTTRQTMFLSRVALADISSFFFDGNANTLLSTLGGAEALTFIKTPRSKRAANWPDLELIMVSGSLASDEGTALRQAGNFKDSVYNKLYLPLQRTEQEHFSILVMQFHPQSIGRMWLHSRNPFDYPRIDPKYFVAEEDVEFILEGIKESLRIAQMPAMQAIGARLLDRAVPGCEDYTFASDDYWRCSIRTLSYTLHHQVATCRMGPSTDPTAVVSPQLKVHGIRKLRVVDTSIIPFPPTAHTNAVAIMLGEKAADLVKNEWQ